MALEHTHTELLHNDRLHSLCRVCGGRSNKSSKPRPPTLCKYVAQELDLFHGINISFDKTDTHSSTLCVKCYARLVKLKSSTNPSVISLQRAKSEINKAAHLWSGFDATLIIQDCPVCSLFISQAKGGRPAKRSRLPPKKDLVSNNSDEVSVDVTIESDVSTFLPLESSTPAKIRRTCVTETQTSPDKTQTPKQTEAHAQTSPLKKTPKKKQADRAVLTSPKKTAVISIRSSTDMSPLSEQEETLLTRLVRVKLAQSADKATLRLKTKGQPLVLKKIVVPRKKSSLAGSPLRKKRANMMEKIRLDVSGNSKEDALRQQGAELKKTTKLQKQSVLKSAGIKQPFISRKLGLAWRTGLGLSWNRHRRQRQLCRRLGIQLESEKAERDYQKELMCGEIRIKTKRLKSASDQSATEEVPVAYIGADDLPSFVSKVLDQFEKENLLTWHENSIPDDEIWIKLGGDHGGGSFKLMLQVANVKEANSKLNTFLVSIVNCKDFHYNLKKVLKPYRQQVTNLQQMEWKGKRIRVFLFGDYDFLLKICGLSGAQSSHPCLWCTASKRQTQKSPHKQPEIPKRTITSIKSDRQLFRHHGNEIKTAKAFNNAIHDPFFDVPLSQVAPPYLHILLGLGKKHHSLLEKECHALDRKIAETLAESDIEYENKTQFGKFVNKLQLLKRTTEEKERELEHVGTELAFHELYLQDNSKTTSEERKEDIQATYDGILAEINELEEQYATTQLPFLFGPVTANLDTVLKQNQITVQAYHGRSFVGNHCHKYLQPNVIESVCQSVVRVTDDMTTKKEIKEQAHSIAKKFFRLNSLYSKVHKHVSHMKPVTPADIKQAEVHINKYMAFYREHFPQTNIIPKQHILEHHIIDFMKAWNFGLALHGEQGGEEIHAFINELKPRARSVLSEGEQLRVLLTEQLTIVSPHLRSLMPSSAGKKKKKTKHNKT